MIINMKTFPIFLALVVCATMVWITEAGKCAPGNDSRCGDKCHGTNHKCKCGNQSWVGTNQKQGCCLTSPDSCIKDNDGKTIFKIIKTKSEKSQFFHSSIFTGNVDCEQGSVLSILQKCPVSGQCLSPEGHYVWQICEDPKTSVKYCAKEKYAREICRGIPNVGCEG